jgi:hypothetical protein
MSQATWRDAEQLASEIEGLQKHKVIELARRLRPGVTAEDIRNPHDFPELGDPDWQFEDGVLAGIQTVLSAIRARIGESQGGGAGETDGNS